MRLVGYAVLLALVTVACSVQDSPNRRAGAPGTSEIETETVQLSVGLVTVGEMSYSIGFDCYAAGAGEILAIGVGDDAVTSAHVEAYVQAFLGAPYLGIEVTLTGGEPVLYEASLDRILEFSVADDIVRAVDVDLVIDLDLDALSGTPAGVGSVVVECREYFDELPEEFATG